MKIGQVSAAAEGGKNEDLVSVFRSQHCTDIVIIDGGTSVADRDYINDDAGDVVWFVTQFSAALQQATSHARSQEHSVALAAAGHDHLILTEHSAAD